LNQPKVGEIIRVLEAKKQVFQLNFEITNLSQPSQDTPAKPFPYLGASLYLTGFYLLLHGMSLLGAVLQNHPHHSEDSAKIGAEASATLRRLTLKYFSSVQEFLHFFLMLSICLIVAGIILLIGGWRLMNGKTQDTQMTITCNS
jgi:hypothetical protein